MTDIIPIQFMYKIGLNLLKDFASVQAKKVSFTLLVTSSTDKFPDEK